MDTVMRAITLIANMNLNDMNSINIFIRTVMSWTWTVKRTAFQLSLEKNIHKNGFHYVGNGHQVFIEIFQLYSVFTIHKLLKIENYDKNGIFFHGS